MPVGFFRILLVETDHEGLGVGEVVEAKAVGEVTVHEEGARVARPEVEIGVTDLSVKVEAPAIGSCVRAEVADDWKRLEDARRRRRIGG